MSPTIELCKQLIERQSVTPNDAGCFPLILDRLENFDITVTRLDCEDVENILITIGDEGPLLIFLGHTDVVPTGPESEWRYPPFEPTEEGDLLFGRGTADMKGSIAAFITATERFLASKPMMKARFGILLTSDEEGAADYGIRYVAPELQRRGIDIDYCLVGEPSSTNKLGDVIKNGRRGSLGATLKVIGKQGHVAYPQLADNPIHKAMQALSDLVATEWDQGNDFFPPTSFQISNINSGTGATNVIPGDMEVVCNFRYSTETTAEELKARVEAVLTRAELNYDITWKLNGEPFLTAEGELVEACVQSVEEITGRSPNLSTSGGTSDGRFIAPLGAQVVELGPLNATIHQVNENVSMSDLNQLSEVYEAIIRRLMT
ncbi:succinyl-diaminopimelate desuccinylase [Umboniibacter marinipuniceus]|uniref:Succinyl-diaminopimelate desuccinylase n=1 Tax=Umboniibacter marinipuniceus TaxID=569599 RepID=A0A3M0A4D8_9GAMM|nr:succinyl-diaminopimelate desuccinylase [Umboniibacter marinipuniceus]RMA79234.1 succinyldiaminopimelate desuccinylase [Umboniibacter marinipuniceus]